MSDGAVEEEEASMRLRATEAILVAAAPPLPPRAEDYPSWTAIALTWLVLFALGFGFAYLLLWYRQRKHEKVVERRQKILEKQRLKRASLNALLAADGDKETALRRERKTKIGRTRRDDGGDRSPEKAPREVVPRRHEHHRRKVKERTRPRVPPYQSPSAASPEERGTAGGSPPEGQIRKSKGFRGDAQVSFMPGIVSAPPPPSPPAPAVVLSEMPAGDVPNNATAGTELSWGQQIKRWFNLNFVMPARSLEKLDLGSAILLGEAFTARCDSAMSSGFWFGIFPIPGTSTALLGAFLVMFRRSRWTKWCPNAPQSTIALGVNLLCTPLCIGLI
ncbi:hypothetical protein FOZ62_029114, partial [Perkinsus olseni]